MTKTTKPAPTAELLRDPSHWVTLRYGREVEKETLSFRFTTEWRGAQVIADVEADRYVHGGWNDGGHIRDSRLSDWRVYVRGLREWDGTDQYRAGAGCTETARSRVSEWIIPLANAWIESDAYTASESKAFAHAILGELRDSHKGHDAARVRTLLTTFRAKLTDDAYDAIVAAVDAFDVYEAAVTRAGRAASGETD